MGDLSVRTAPQCSGVEDVIRLRMMGVHVPRDTRGRRARDGARPNGSDLHRVLAALDLPHGDITDVHWYTARRPVARVGFSAGHAIVLKWLDRTELETDNEAWALAMLDRAPLTTSLRAALPRLLGATADGRVQAFAHVDATTTWADRHTAGDEHLTSLGECLADLHGLPVCGPADRHLHFPIPALGRLTPAEFVLGYGADFPEYILRSAANRGSWYTSGQKVQFRRVCPAPRMRGSSTRIWP